MHLLPSLCLLGTLIISIKAAMVPGVGRSEMSNILARLTSLDTRIFVVYMYSNDDLKLMSEAMKLEHGLCLDSHRLAFFCFRF